MVLIQIIVATTLVGLISFLGILFFGLKLNVRQITFYLISLASGTMLGVAFLHLIPEAMKENPERVFLFIAMGVFFFFILEKFLVWRHCHHHQRPEDHTRPVAAAMILSGDAAHNFIDGIIIASSFLVGPATGLSVTLAIVLHEIPQELGDFGVLIHGGLTMKQALFYNALSATTGVLGGILTYFSLNALGQIHSVILPVAAGGFLYIALADLIPQLHEQVAPKQSLAQILLLAAGFGVMMALPNH